MKHHKLVKCPICKARVPASPRDFCGAGHCRGCCQCAPILLRLERIAQAA